MDSDIIAALIGAAGGLIGALLGALFGHRFSMIQIRKEQQEILKTKMMGDKIESYKKFLSLLKPTSEGIAENERAIILKGDKGFINEPVVRKLFDGISDFIYSIDGVALSWNLVQEVIPTAKKFILEAIKSGEPQPNGQIGISKTDAKRAQRGLNWIRQKALEESGLRDTEDVNKALQLKKK